MATTYHAGRRIQALSTDYLTPIQGFDGGQANASAYTSGGGGGSSSVGGNGVAGQAGNGGTGTQSDITGASPTPYYSAGGGGGLWGTGSTAGSGGSSIGGNGSSANNAGGNASGYGSGGGGAGVQSGGGNGIDQTGGNGSAGVVILNFTSQDFTQVGGTVGFVGGYGNTDADDVSHFESTSQLNKIIGEKIEVNNPLIGQTVTKLKFKLFRMDSGTISDTLTFGVWDFVTGDLKTNGSFGTVRIDSLAYNASSSHSNAEEVTLVHSGSGVTIDTNDIIGIRSDVDTMTNKRVEVAQHDDATPDSYANGARCIFTQGANSPASVSTKDIWFQAGTSSDNTTVTWTATSGTTFTPTSAFDVRYLVIGGGAGGGASKAGNAGGGGAGSGGFRTATVHGVTAKTYNITVGALGAGGVAGTSIGSNGGDSSFDGIISIGGGGGSLGVNGAYYGQDGASGGGASPYATTNFGKAIQQSIEKPSNVQAGIRLEETDTRKIYYKDDIDWKEENDGTIPNFRSASWYEQLSGETP